MGETGVTSSRYLPEFLRGRYRVRKLLGEGGMGAVVLARDRELSRLVAIKLVSAVLSEEARARFSREARSLAGLKSGHILKVFAFDATVDPPYLVTEFLEGSEIGKVEDLDPLPAMLDVATGLEEAHQAGILHRDIKPANVFYTREERAVLIDFGLVQAQLETNLTATGYAVGTPPFMAPEQLRMQKASPASDWYQWGVTLFFLYERRLPFGRTIAEKIMTGRPLPSLEFEQLDPESPEAYLLRACLQERAEDRPQCYADIRTILANPTTASRSQRLARQGLSDTAAATGVTPSHTRLRPYLVASLLLGLVGLGLLIPGRSLLESPPSFDTESQRASLPRSVKGISPFPENYGKLLAAELSSALDGTVDPEGKLTLGGGDGIPLLESFRTRGMMIFDQLPAQQLFFDWLSAGGRPEDLSHSVLEQLRGYDQSFRDMDLPAQFAPFLDAAPAEGMVAIPDWLVDEFPDRPDFSAWRGKAYDGYIGAALLAAMGAMQERIRLEEEILDGGGLLSPRLLRQMGQIEEGDVVAGTVRFARQMPTVRSKLENMLGRGRALTRLFMICGKRGLDSPDAPALGTFFDRISRKLRPFLIHTMLTASPVRLVGGAPEALMAQLFRAQQFEGLQWHRRTALLWLSISAEELAEMWRGIHDQAIKEGNFRLARTAWMRELKSLRWNVESAAFRELYLRHKARYMEQLPPDDQAELHKYAKLLKVE